MKYQQGKFYRTDNNIQVQCTHVTGTHAIFHYLNGDAFLTDENGEPHSSHYPRVGNEWAKPIIVIPWHLLPPHIIAWAMDRNYDQYYYATIPSKTKKGWRLLSDITRPYMLLDYFIPMEPEHEIEYTGDWRESLQVRP